MFKILLFALLAWFLYKLVFRVIIPVYRTTKQVKRQFREMKEKMDAHQARQNGYARPEEVKKPTVKTPAGDYLDFEELK